MLRRIVRATRAGFVDRTIPRGVTLDYEGSTATGSGTYAGYYFQPLAGDGSIPNNPALALVVYRRAIDLSGTPNPEEVIERTFARNGFNCTGFDIDPGKIEKLKNELMSRELAEARKPLFVDDPARLGFGAVDRPVVVVGPEQVAGGELALHHQARLRVAGKMRVAAEGGGEPRHAGVGVGAVRRPGRQHRQVGARARQHAVEHAVRGLDLRHAAGVLSQRIGGASVLDAVAARRGAERR